MSLATRLSPNLEVRARRCGCVLLEKELAGVMRDEYCVMRKQNKKSATHHALRITHHLPDALVKERLRALDAVSDHGLDGKSRALEHLFELLEVSLR
jgi:hypothetical protein